MCRRKMNVDLNIIHAYNLLQAEGTMWLKNADKIG